MESEQNIGVKTDKVFNELPYYNISINSKGEATLCRDAFENGCYDPEEIATRKAVTFLTGTSEELKGKFPVVEGTLLYYTEIVVSGVLLVGPGSIMLKIGAAPLFLDGLIRTFNMFSKMRESIDFKNNTFLAPGIFDAIKKVEDKYFTKPPKSEQNYLG